MIKNITGFEDKFCPNNFDKAESIRKGLASGLGEFNDKYYKLCNIYKKLVELLLAETTLIDECDILLKQSELQYKPVTSDEKDIYQEGSIFEYFYLRNTLYVECLPKEYIDYLLSLDLEHLSLGEKEREIISTTLQIVITNNHPDHSHLTNYGPFSAEFFAPINGLVIGVRYDPYEDQNAPGYDDDLWFENNIKQDEFLNGLCTKLENDFKSETFQLKVIRYNENSVIPLKKNSEEYRLT